MARSSATSDVGLGDADHDENAPPSDLDGAREQSALTDEAPAKPKRAPRKRTRKPRADTAPRSSAPRTTSLKKRLHESISTLGAMLCLVSPADGQLIIAGAEKQAAALDSLARENPAVKRALERMLTASIYGQLIGAFAPTLLGLAANHGMLPGPANALVKMATAPAPAAGGINLGDLGLGDVNPADLLAMASQFATAMGGSNDGGAGAPFGAVVGVG